METVGFTRMEDGSREDYLLLDRLEKEHTSGTAARVLEQLLRLSNSYGGYKIDRLQHSLQVATRAYRDNADEEMVVAALLHDIGDLLAPHNHCEVAAAILKPYVSKRTYWIIKKHGLFQSYYYAHHLGGDRDAREKYRGHPFLRLRRPSATCGTSLPSTRTTTHCPLRHLTHWCGVSFLENRSVDTRISQQQTVILGKTTCHSDRETGRFPAARPSTP